MGRGGGEGERERGGGEGGRERRRECNCFTVQMHYVTSTHYRLDCISEGCHQVTASWKNSVRHKALIL